MDQLENQSQRNNIRIVNLKVGVDGPVQVWFFTDRIPMVLGQQFPQHIGYLKSALVPGIPSARSEATQIHPHPLPKLPLVTT